MARVGLDHRSARSLRITAFMLAAAALQVRCTVQGLEPVPVEVRQEAPVVDATPGNARTNAELLELVAIRGAIVRTLTADLVLDLERADGAQARLAASLTMERPDRIRVRSTKWGFQVCDVVVMGTDARGTLSPVVREQAISSAQATVALAGVLGSLVGWHVSSLQAFDEGGDEIILRFEGGADDALALEWTVARDDARVLLVRRFEHGEVTGTLACSAHECVEGVPLPTRLRFESAMGRIDVEVRRPAVNTTLPREAFELPAGAEAITSASR